jgi:hypothetical protein
MALARPQDAANDLLPAMRAAAELIDAGADPDYRLYVFTDMQARALGLDKAKAPAAPAASNGAPEEPSNGAAAGAQDFEDTLRDVLERVKKRAEVIFFDVSPQGSGGRIDNLQLTGLALLDPLVIAKVAVPVQVTVGNRGEQARAVQVTLEIDGAAPVRQQVQLDAGAEQSVEFPVTFREVGLRTLKASIESDGLEADDARWLVVPVRDRVRLLLVEGSDETESALQEAAHLRAVLDPTGGEGSAELVAFAPRTIDTMQFWSNTEPLDAYDLVALCNVESVPAEVADKLKSAMAAGTSLLLVLGNRVKSDLYNAQLWAGGTGPMPLQLGAAQGYVPLGRDSYGSEIVEVEHPVFADFGKEFRDIFQQIPVYKYFATEKTLLAKDGLAKDGRVLARLRDQEQNPLLVTGTFGDGKVAVLTTSLSRRPDRWNDLHLELIAFPLLHPLARWLTVAATNPYNNDVGGVLTVAMKEKPRDVAFITSERGGALRSPVGEEARPLTGARYGLPPCRDTAFAGIYVADMQVERDGVLTPRQVPFAVNVESSEGSLDYASAPALRERLGVERVLRDLPADGSTSIESARNDFGPLLLLVTLLFLLSEAALARFVSTRRG